MGRPKIERWLLIAFLGLAFLVRLYIAWQPVPFLLRLNLPDDAFYYFVIARRMLGRAGPTFDGLTLNNGFHPLWLLILLPLFAVKGPNADFPVHLALTVGAALDVCTCYLLYRIAVRLSGRPLSGLIAALTYGFNVMSALQATNGLETALGGALAVVCWWGAIDLAERPTIRRAVVWGGSVGLMLLARTDYVLLLVCLGLYLMVYWRGQVAWGMMIWAAVIALAMLSPWLIWNQVVFGSPMQVSGVAVPYAIHQRHIMTNGPGLAIWLQKAFCHLLYPAGWLRGDFAGAPPLIGPILWVLVGCAIGVSWRQGNRLWIGAWLPMTASAGGLVLIHTLLRWYPRPWYFVPSALALAVGLGVGVPLITDALPRWGRRVFAMTLGILGGAALIAWVFVWQIGFYPWQDRMFEAARWVAQNVSQDQIVASFNAGIYGYYSGRTVVNLDGVVNPKAYAAIRERRLFAYMQEIDIHYLLDFDNALDNEYGVFMGPGYPAGLVEVAYGAAIPYPNLGVLRVFRVASQ